ncbi:MAG TPA: hypothetical protein VI791_00410 [Patescibacteria group bacterium]|nr:hypothetical protein [Patescibacteria group bacterium]
MLWVVEHRFGIHPQLRGAYGELYDELKGEGLSDEEALRRLNTDFDWALNELRKPILSPREDEFADDEHKRDKAAENGDDLASQWLEAREKNDGSHLMFELMLGLRKTGV